MKIYPLLNFQESNTSLHKPSLEMLRSQIKSSTSSMTSVPKPLKFLRHHYQTMKDLFNEWSDEENKVTASVFITFCCIILQYKL